MTFLGALIPAATVPYTPRTASGPREFVSATCGSMRAPLSLSRRVGPMAHPQHPVRSLLRVNPTRRDPLPLHSEPTHMHTESDLVRTILDYLHTRSRGTKPVVQEHQLGDYLIDKGFKWSWLRHGPAESERIYIWTIVDELVQMGCLELCGPNGRSWKFARHMTVPEQARIQARAA